MNNQKEDELEKLAENKFPFNSNWDNINYEQRQRLKAHILQRRQDFKDGYAASTPSEQGSDGWIAQELKELDASFDYLYKMQGVKDAGHCWIEFTDKWNAFKKRLQSKE